MIRAICVSPHTFSKATWRIFIKSRIFICVQLSNIFSSMRAHIMSNVIGNTNNVIINYISIDAPCNNQKVISKFLRKVSPIDNQIETRANDVAPLLNCN